MQDYIKKQSFATLYTATYWAFSVCGAFDCVQKRVFWHLKFHSVVMSFDKFLDCCIVCTRKIYRFSC